MITCKKQVFMKKKDFRSDCPINYLLENLGDKWTLLIVRDLVFEGKKFYRDFLNSDEGIATNILSKRLRGLEDSGIVESEVYEKQRTMKVYSLTEKGKDLIPVLLEMIVWSTTYGEDLKVSKEFAQKIKTNRDELLPMIKACIGTTAFSSSQIEEKGG